MVPGAFCGSPLADVAAPAPRTWESFFQGRGRRPLLAKDEPSLPRRDRQDDFVRDRRDDRDRFDDRHFRRDRDHSDRRRHGLVEDYESVLRRGDEYLSHRLGRILRYHAADSGLCQDADGFVALSEILEQPAFRGAKEDDLVRVTEESVSSKGPRFELKRSESRGSLVRATYRHQDRVGGRRFGGYQEGNRDFRPRESRGKGAYAGADCRKEVTSSSSADRGPHQIEEVYGALDAARHLQGWSSTNCTAAVGLAKQPDVTEEWERYVEPGTNRAWFWNEGTEEIFFEDDAAESGWERFVNSEGRTWWYHEVTERFFFEAEAP